MELAEFEETVAKESDLLDAGALEVFLTDRPRFLRRDFSVVAGELHMAVHVMHSSLGRWNEVGLAALVSAWEEQAIRITEFREESVRRKKALGTVLRLFGTQHLSGAALDAELVRADGRAMIEAFKADYDYLSSSLKFAEATFFSTFKILHDVSDPCSIFEQCQGVCLRAQDALKEAQEQLVVAEEMLNERAAGMSHNVDDGSDDGREEEVSVLQKTIADLQQSLQEERMAVRTRLEGELRRREYELRSTFEQQQLHLQKQMDDALSRKDLEISSLASSLDAAAHQQLESSERDRGLDVERRKRLELEEKFRGTLSDLGYVQKQCADMRSQLSEAASTLRRRDEEAAAQQRAYDSSTAALENTLVALKARVLRQDADLKSRPPADLSSFAQKAGLGGDILPTGGEQPSWEAVEALLLQSVRRISGEAAEVRVREQEAARRLLLLEEDVLVLRAHVVKDAAAAVALEADLVETTRALESSRALLKCYTAVKGTETASNSPAKGATADKRQGSSAAYSPGHSKIATPSRRATDADDIEVGSGGKGVALAVGPSAGDGDGEGADRMLAAVQAQRDRYMRSALDREGELSTLRVSYERLQDEQQVLRTENLELFRRLRVLRVSAKDGAAPRAAGRGRRSATVESLYEDASVHDPIDEKYGSIYEGQIDPFRVQELDRQAVLSRLNAFERGLAQAMRLLAADPLARYALLFYLLLVHLFACGYVFQVLNPQLVDEVDAGLKRRWAEQAMAGEEHLDV